MIGPGSDKNDNVKGGLQKAAYLKEAEKLKADNLALKAEVSRLEKMLR